MPATVKAIVTNADVIAVDQDPLGKQGTRVAMSGATEVWAKPMHDGSVAVVLFNNGAASASVSVTWSQIGVTGSSRIHDLWSHTDVGTSASGYSAMVASSDVVVIRVYPPGSGDDGGTAAEASAGLEDAVAPPVDQEGGGASTDATVSFPPDTSGGSGETSDAIGPSGDAQGGSSSGDATTGGVSGATGSGSPAASGGEGTPSGSSGVSGVGGAGTTQTCTQAGAAASGGCSLRATGGLSPAASAGVTGLALGLWLARRRPKKPT